MPTAPLFHEEYHFNSIPYDHTGDSIQLFCAFHSCFKPGFVCRGSDGRYAIYALVTQGNYRSLKGRSVTAGSFIWSRAGTPYQRTVISGDEDVRRKVIMLHQNSLHEMVSSRFFPETHGVLPLCDPRAVEAIFDQFYDELALKKPNEAKLAGLFFQLLHEVAAQQQQSLYSPLMEKIIAYISANLHDPALSCADIAGHCNVSMRTLNRLFNKELKTSVTQYIINTRLSKVCSLLSIPELQIKEIAAQCGFCTSAFMSYRFKKKYARTPGEYRKIILQPGTNSPAE